MQRGGGVGDSQGMQASGGLGVFLLKGLGDLTHRQPAGADDRADGFQFFRSKVNIREWNAPIHSLLR